MNYAHKEQKSDATLPDRTGFQFLVKFSFKSLKKDPNNKTDRNCLFRFCVSQKLVIIVSRNIRGDSNFKLNGKPMTTLQMNVVRYC